MPEFFIVCHRVWKRWIIFFSNCSGCYTLKKADVMTREKYASASRHYKVCEEESGAAADIGAAGRAAETVRGELLRLKKACRFTEKRLGDKVFAPLGVKDPQKKVNNILSGKTKLCLEDFIRLCREFQVSAGEILSWAIREASLEVEAAWAGDKKEGKNVMPSGVQGKNDPLV